jgi:hypothetical protein
MKKPGAVQRLDAIEDEWSRKATQAAIEAARSVTTDASMNGRAPISSISDVQWGWIVCAAIFAWIKTKAQQAVQEGVGYDTPIRFMPGTMQPWEAGAVEAILPSLGGLPGVDWNKPLADFDKGEMVSLAWNISSLVAHSLVAQAQGSEDKITQFSKDRQEREVSAANGGPLMSRRELNDEPPWL